MARTSLRRTVRNARKKLPSRKAVAKSTRQAGAQLKKAAVTLEKAAGTYARKAKAAGAAVGSKAKKMSKTRSGKVLAAAALATAGYVAVRKARKR